jgi:hypothetical protein
MVGATAELASSTMMYVKQHAFCAWLRHCLHQLSALRSRVISRSGVCACAHADSVDVLDEDEDVGMHAPSMAFVTRLVPASLEELHLGFTPSSQA